ncbi:uncharacterized protein LOC128876580 isoform X1 [Hylaeus volcanicus]|uniref:uncharacterized protein LOC128876580 isoform X1 n=1 Tax=Hylaeus volcanicus TaxID=313075 RepID=UPI0023B78D1C|nr:uncharacterized protein LOC128876580 isoform X1 [Hylaeus volcanicus]
MDIKIVTLLVLLGIVGSLAEPLHRMRRNGLQESDKPRGMEFVGMPRAKRESVDSSTTENTATPTSTADPSTTRGTSPTTTNKPDPPTETAPTPGSRSTTIKPSPTPDPTTTEPPSTTAKPASTTPEKVTTTKKPTNPEKSTKPSPAIGSRIDPSEEQPQQPETKPNPAAAATPSQAGGNPAFPSYSPFPNPAFFMPSFIPDYSAPYTPYGDPTFNSIPGANNNNLAWTSTSNGGGASSSFAGASAGSFGYGQPSFGSRGSFVDDGVQASGYPNSNSDWASSGGLPFSNFAFPGNFENQMQDHFKQLQDQFQQQQEFFRKQQAQIQAQNQAIYRMFQETANRINSAPNANSAVSGINLGPRGGFQYGAVDPAAPGLESRFAEEIPAPSGGRVAVFSSSSSNSMTGPDGKTISHRTSTTGVDDNGKVKFRTITS